MQDIQTYIVVSTFIYLYITNMATLLLKVNGVKTIPKNHLFGWLFTHKPFNCGVCLSLWVGMIISLLTFNVFYLTLPLSFKLLNKYL